LILNHLRSHFVAYVALFFALGGTSFAAAQALPRNSVGTTQLKRNAVTGAKVKNNSLTGADILESRLGKVPSARAADNASHARTADSATTAANATSAANATNAANAANAANAGNAGNANALQGHGPAAFVSSGDYKRVLAKMQAGDERELIRNGPISIYARCVQAGADDQIRMYARTDVDGAIMVTTWGDTRDGTDATDFLNTSTPESDREWENSASIATGVTGILFRYDNSQVIAPTGEMISWEGESELLAFNYLGARCIIAGDVHLTNLS
jgi:hypothetical protein